MDPDPPEPGRPSRSEFDAIARWCDLLPTTSEHVATGPGDDAAWLRWRGNLAISTDSFLEGIHFERSWSEGAAVGRRALAAALSDLAASRARPLACVLSLAAARFDAWCDEVMEGVASGGRDWSCPIVGGDTTGSPGGLVLNITVLGEATAAGPLLRSGAEPGDLLQLSGLPGKTSRAVELLLGGTEAEWPGVRPRFDLLDSLAGASAGIDLSDGLLADAEHLSTASGVGLRIDRDGSWDRHVLCGGEDYELLVTAPQPLEGFQVVGEVVEGVGLSFSDGSPLPPKPWGFDHGSTERR